MNGSPGYIWHSPRDQEEEEVKSPISPLPGKIRCPPARFVVPVSLFSTPCQMVEVIVGGGEETKSFSFIIHEPLLATSSLLFKKKLAAASKDGNDTIVLELVGISPLVFGSINRYLYTGGLGSLEHDHLPPLPLCSLCDVWLLADQFGMPKLMDHVIWLLVKQLDKCRPDEVRIDLPWNLETIYERAPTKSKLRKLLLDMCVWHMQDFKQPIRSPTQMGWDLFEQMKVQRSGAKNPLLDVRNYYIKQDEFAQYGDVLSVPPMEPSIASTQQPLPKYHFAEATFEPAEPVHNSSNPISQPGTPIITSPPSAAAVPEPSTTPQEQAVTDAQSPIKLSCGRSRIRVKLPYNGICNATPKSSPPSQSMSSFPDTQPQHFRPVNIFD